MKSTVRQRETIRQLVAGELTFPEYRAKLSPQKRRAGDLRVLAALIPDGLDAPLLDDRDWDTLRDAAQGLTATEAADRAGVSPSTIADRRRRVILRLGAKNLTQAVALSATLKATP